MIRFARLSIGLAVLATVTSGCVANRRYNESGGRINQGTAYVLPGGDLEVSGGLVGLEYTDFGASLDLRYGIADVADVRVNVAHAVAGILSLGIGVNILDTKYFGLGIDASLLFARASAIWALPDAIREPIEDVSLLVVPIQTTASLPVAEWSSVHLSLRYVHGDLFGSVEDDATLIDAGVGLRIASVAPSIHFYASGWLAVIVGADLPFLVFGRENTEVTTDVEPGVRGGVRSVEWVSLPVEPLINVYGAVEASLGDLTIVRISVVRNAVARAVELPLLPALLVATRF